MNSKQLILTPSAAKRIEDKYCIVRRSVDARQRNIKVNLTVATDDAGNYLARTSDNIAASVSPLRNELDHLLCVQDKPAVRIVGGGPAGLFAALTLLRHGYRPVIYERGKQVSERKIDIARLNRNQGLNPESNYCFGEGGAGTFSDGKLFSRSKKRGDMQQVMELFHYFGASNSVLYEAHAHIGSDKLPGIIRNMREFILAHGGEVHFNTCVDAALFAQWQRERQPVILAIGHSAHDTYRMLIRAGVAMEAKGCAIGVRVEHPQPLIDRLMYHLGDTPRSLQADTELVQLLGHASYTLVTQVDGRGVYSFCMCPGGHIVPAGSAPGGCVVNGMSASHRNSPYANSGMVVELHPEDFGAGDTPAPEDALAYQEHIESLAHQAAGDGNRAPAQRLRDFVEGRMSTTLPDCSYLPGVVPSRLDQWLPQAIGHRLRAGFRDFDRKYPGFLTNDAIVIGVESRSSSPVRIVRDMQTMQSLSHAWLYPCGEGAGYAGGITSSALDGIKAALSIIHAAQTDC